MKFASVILLAFFGSALAAADRPRLAISVRDGEYNDLAAGLDPVLTWENSQKSGDLDISYGLEASARPTDDVSTLAKSFWAKAATNVGGWNVGAKASVNAQKFDHANLEFDALNTKYDVALNLVANARGKFNLKTVEATKGVDVNGARVTLTPRYDAEADYTDVVLTYNVDNTNVKITASQSGQEVTLSQQIDSKNRLSPTINNHGDLSLEWERRLSDSSLLTASLKPNDNLNLEWQDGDWTANVNMPVSGTQINGANISIKREVIF